MLLILQGKTHTRFDSIHMAGSLSFLFFKDTQMLLYFASWAILRTPFFSHNMLLTSAWAIAVYGPLFQENHMLRSGAILGMITYVLRPSCGFTQKSLILALRTL